MRWRVRAALRGALAAGDEVRAVARDEIGRDHWVLTEREILRLKGREVIQRMLLTDAVGTVTSQPAAGVTIRVHSRRSAHNHMLTSFRKDNAVTRGLAALFDKQPESE